MAVAEAQDVFAEIIASSSSPPPIPDEQVWDIAAARRCMMAKLWKTTGEPYALQECECLKLLSGSPRFDPNHTT